MRKGQLHLLEQTQCYSFRDVIDIGTGSGDAARYFLRHGKKVMVTGFDMESYLLSPLPEQITVLRNVDVCDMSGIGDNSFDAVWCAHVLEHVLDTGRALDEIRRILRPTGYLFVSVPEYSPYVVGGHVSTGWNLGSLMYVLLVAGFDVRNGSFINHCWNITAFVKSGDIPCAPLRYDKGDIETLISLFPTSIHVQQGFDGDLTRVNWRWNETIKETAEKEYRAFLRRRRLHDWIPPVLHRRIRKWKISR